MRAIFFIEEPKVIDMIIHHLKLSSQAVQPSSPQNDQQELFDGSRGDWGVFLRASVAVFYQF